MGRGGVGAPGQGYDAGSLLVFATSAAPVDARALAAPFLALERAGVLVTFARCASPSLLQGSSSTAPSVLVGQRHPLGPSETQTSCRTAPSRRPNPPDPPSASACGLGEPRGLTPQPAGRRAARTCSAKGGPLTLRLGDGREVELGKPKGLEGDEPEPGLPGDVDLSGEDRLVREFLETPAALARMRRCLSLTHAFGVSGVSYDGVYLPGGPGMLEDVPDAPRARVILQNMVLMRKPICALGEGLGLLLGATQPDDTPFLKGRTICAFGEKDGWAATKFPAGNLKLGQNLLVEGAKAAAPGSAEAAAHGGRLVRDGTLITCASLDLVESAAEMLGELATTYKDDSYSIFV